jgi:hypothetical protein
MTITKEDLANLLKIQTDVEKITTISNDGKNLLIRIPKEIRETVRLEKGDKFRWMLSQNNKLMVEVIKNGKN